MCQFKQILSYIFLLSFSVYGFAQNQKLNLGNDWRSLLYEQTPRLFFKSLDFNISPKYNTEEINLFITDTVVIVKNSRNRNSYAAKVNVEINVPVLTDTIFLYSFNQYVITNEFFCDMSPFDAHEKSSIGLQYIVEDKNNHIMEDNLIRFVSYTYRRGAIKSMNSRWFVTSKQKIKHRLLNDIERTDYDRAKYKICNEKQNLTLYPLLGSFHFNLPNGEYYLYFVYSFNPSLRSVKSDIIYDSRTFKGSFVSNKVKLIVK